MHRLRIQTCVCFLKLLVGGLKLASNDRLLSVNPPFQCFFSSGFPDRPPRHLDIRILVPISYLKLCNVRHVVSVPSSPSSLESSVQVSLGSMTFVFCIFCFCEHFARLSPVSSTGARNWRWMVDTSRAKRQLRIHVHYFFCCLFCFGLGAEQSSSKGSLTHPEIIASAPMWRG